MDSLSLSNSVSKKTRFENTEMSTAYFEDLKNRKDDTISNERIQNGDTILNTYEVTSDAISGGMGSVWRVHHQSWNTDLAMKRPKPRFFAEGGDTKKAQFVAECENWINLGLHPNIVSCYYVREIGGVPTIFSEWMDGGSLADRIKDGSLYEGTEEEIQERILDIAIQAARGLQYSHENGLIHQDFKPGNLLLTKEWDAKVADFGLAKAKSNLDDKFDTTKTTGYTLAYCPQEQVNREEPQKWMDVYSWALTVLEMYAGKRLWETGAEVKESVNCYFGKCIFSVPKKMISLLKDCLIDKHDGFSKVENRLTDIYKDIIKKDYRRTLPKAAEKVASSLNNMALSYLDLGKPKEAEKCWTEAIKQNAAHIESLYNLALLRWRRAEIDDIEALNQLNPCKQSGEYERLISKLELERGNPEGVKDGAEETDCEFAKTLPKMDLYSIESEYQYTSLLTSPDGGRLLAVQRVDENNIGFELYDSLHKKPYKIFRTEKKDDTAFSGFAIDWAGSRFAILKEEKQKDQSLYYMCIYDLNSLELMCKLSVDSDCGEPCLFCPEGTRIYTREGIVIDSGSGTALGKITRENDCCSIYHMEISRNGKTLAVCWNTKQEPLDHFYYLCLYDALSLIRLQALKELAIDGNNAKAVFSKESNRVFFTKRNERLYILNTQSSNCYSFRMDNLVKVGTPGDIVLNTDSSLLIKCFSRRAEDYSSMLKLIETHEGRCLRSFLRESKPKTHIPWMLRKTIIEKVAFLEDRIYISEEKGLSSFHIPAFGYHANWALSKIENITQRLKSDSLFLSYLEQAKKVFSSKAYAEAMKKLDEARRIDGMYNDPRALKLNRDIGEYCKRVSLDSVNLLKRIDVALMCSRIIFSNDEKLMLCVYSEKAYLISLHSQKILRSFTPSNEMKSSLRRLGAALNADGSILCFGDGYLYDTVTGQKRGKLERHDTWTCSAGFSQDGTIVATGSENGRLFLHRVEDCSLICEFNYGNNAILDIQFFSDGDSILYSPMRFVLDIVSISQKKIIRRFSKETGLKLWNYHKLAVSPDGKYALIEGISTGYFTIDLVTGRVLNEVPHSKYVSMVYTGYQQQLMCMTNDKKLVFIPSLTDEPEIIITDDFKRSFALAVSPNMNYAAVDSGYMGINLYELNWKYKAEPIQKKEVEEPFADKKLDNNMSVESAPIESSSQQQTQKNNAINNSTLPDNKVMPSKQMQAVKTLKKKQGLFSRLFGKK